MKIVEINNGFAVDLESGQMYSKKYIPKQITCDGVDVNIVAPVFKLTPVNDNALFDLQTDEECKVYEELAADVLGESLYCSRVWEAWGYGTMSSDDFSVMAEDTDYVAEQAVKIWKIT